MYLLVALTSGPRDSKALPKLSFNRRSESGTNILILMPILSKHAKQINICFVIARIIQIIKVVSIVRDFYIMTKPFDKTIFL